MYADGIATEFREKFLTDDFSVSYTLETDDITHGKKPQGTPYVSRIGVFDEKLRRGRYKSGNNRFEKPWKRRRAQPHKEKAA